MHLGAALVTQLGSSFAHAEVPDECHATPPALACRELPTTETERRAALVAWDEQGRREVARGDLLAATTSFGCLLAADPTPESAGNLTVVLRERGLLGDALSMARCAELLAPAGPARVRAQTRREDLERRLALTLPRTASELGPKPTTVGVELARRPSDEREPREAHAPRAWAYLGWAVGGAALLASAGAFAMARSRASDFSREQDRAGYTAEAQSLRSSANGWQTASVVAAILGGGAVATGFVLSTF